MTPTHVPYRGSAPAITDLIGGHLPRCITVLGDFLPQIANPVLRMPAVANSTLSKFLPNVPTFAEQGFPSVVSTEAYGIFLPKGTSGDRVTRVNAALRDAVGSPDIIAALAQIGMEPASTTAESYRAYLERERQLWAPIVKASGFALDE
ncbi:MAG: tripartite tricarboxylate transporter substrate-binding protein [Hyphomicrobiales bacterium]|nr:tripartite tricarboxylate transporter substrate-binding protein [Hyphomicrobiales bacterium]